MEKVGKIELGQKPYHVILTWSSFRISFQAPFPDLLYFTVWPQVHDKVVGLRTKPKELVVEWIMKNIPLLATEELLAHLHCWSQTDFETRYAMP